MDKKTKDEEIYDIIRALKPEIIPPEFISSGRVTDLDGNSYIVSCEELEDIMASPNSLEEMGIYQIRLNMDLESIVDAVITHTENILRCIPE